MSSESFIKGACTACGGHIEFPTAALGSTVACPHCGSETRMLANLPPVLESAPASVVATPSVPGPQQTPVSVGTQPLLEKFSTDCPGCGLEVSVKADTCPSCGATIRERSLLTWPILVSCVVAIVLLAGTALMWQRGGLRKKPQVKLSEVKLPKKAANLPSAPDSTPPTPAPAPAPVMVKRSGEFKMLDHRIERVPGRSLVYVVGNVTNDTEKQQFSVRVTFELTDKTGKPAGTATDYASVIEPGSGWQFRAMILETNAVRAKLMTLETDTQ